LFKNGAVNYYLSKTDYTKKVDGVTASDITTGNDGDVMIEIPKVAYMLYYVGNNLYIKVTDNPDARTLDSRYSFAHTRDTQGDRAFMYIGAYLSGTNILNSLSGKTPYSGLTINSFRIAVQSKGTGYNQITFHAITLLQALYVIRFKHLNCQVALGRGYVDNNAVAHVTGGTNTKGMYFGETTGQQQMKCFGIEDLWGNLYQWVEGLFVDASMNLLTAYKTFSDAATGYTNQGAVASYSGGFIAKVQGTTARGFLPLDTSGSSTTFFCDHAAMLASSVAFWGGRFNNALSNDGIFRMALANPVSTTDNAIGARLMYL
jgi:hypothetical protein